jgi:TRAP-type C4-dicarboxylate transport system permease small subunit
VTEPPPDGDEDGLPKAKAVKGAEQLDGVPDKDSDVPPTRQHEAQPPVRKSMLELTTQPEVAYPDDGATSGKLRMIDRYLGIGEQGVLFGILAIIVLTGSAHAIIEKATHKGLWWSFDVIRGGTFAIAMIGAAYATQQMRHLAMDLVSRKLPPVYRLILSAVLELFTIGICVLLAKSGLHQVDAVGKETGRHLFEASTIASCLPLGAALISVHAALHLVIDIDYLIRGKTMPERMRSGH